MRSGQPQFRREVQLDCGSFVVLHQPFESELLQIVCARVETFLPASDQRAQELTLALRSVLFELGCDLAWYRCDAGETSVATAFKAVGALEVEELVTFVRQMQEGERPPTCSRVGIATHDDATEVANMVGRSFVYDRFHSDPRISLEKADLVKSVWMRNSVLGRSDRVFVVRSEGQVAGALACAKRSADIAIDLIAVEKNFQRRGFAEDLVRAAINHYSGLARRIFVGTQAKNVPSISLYSKLGFERYTSQFTFHLFLRDIQ
ncbi:MAG: GNAT family N-acetyltransferase [Rhizobiaceae bacterium]